MLLQTAYPFDCFKIVRTILWTVLWSQKVKLWYDYLTILNKKTVNLLDSVLRFLTVNSIERFKS